MPRWVKIVGTVLVLIAIVGGAGYYWYLGDGNAPAQVRPYTIDMAAVRARAAELPGGRASDIRVEKVASFAFPEAAVVAGDGWGALPMGAYAFEIVLPADTIIIDTALDPAAAGELMAEVDMPAFGRMSAAMERASFIVLTHEHSDHVGGVLAHRNVDAIRKALRLTEAQVEGLAHGGLALPTGLADYVPVAYDGMLAIAPGVVLIAAPGHTPGSQMVYVQREDGRELLFTGDIAWSQRNIETGRGRPRLMSELILGEDRDAVFGQLAALKILRETESNLVIVPGHDAAAIDAIIDSGAMNAGFTP